MKVQEPSGVGFWALGVGTEFHSLFMRLGPLGSMRSVNFEAQRIGAPLLSLQAELTLGVVVREMIVLEGSGVKILSPKP